jgi:NitT/TauT family transport system permease protein
MENGFLRSAALLLVGVLAWQLLCVFQLVNPLLLASPTGIANDLWVSVWMHQFWIDCYMTFRRVLIAFVIAIFCGVPIGVFMGASRFLTDLLNFPVDFARSIPATALFPLFMLLFGVAEGSRIAAAAYGCMLIMVVNTMSGVKQANETRVLAARAYGARGIKLLIYVLLPESLPNIVTGMRLSVSLAFVIIVLVEMFIGTEAGLGHRIIDAQIIYNIPRMYAAIFVVGTAGYIANWLMLFSERRLVHFVGK